MDLELPPDFKELFRLLNSEKVKYLLIGGYAVIIHGYPRNTSDLDVVVSNDEENAERCVRALTAFGFGGPNLTKDRVSGPLQNVIRLGVAPVKIEILNYLKGVDFQQAYKRRLSKSVEDIHIDVIALDDLIANKTEVGRLQDLTDVEKLKERNGL